MNINEELFLVQDDHGIRKILSKINANTNVMKFFANHEIDAPAFAKDILAISYDPPLDESGATNDVNNHDDGNQPAFDVNEDDDALSIESKDVGINSNHSDGDDNEEGNEDKSDDNDGYNDGNEKEKRTNLFQCR